MDSFNPFKWRQFQGEIILGCVRWYCKYGISYRELEEMMEERGVDVDHTTIYRWVQSYAPEIERRLRYFWKPTLGSSWRVDETYVKVKGQWKYLYRAITKEGETVDFYLSRTRNLHSAKTFLAKALRSFKDYERPTLINTDKAPAYGAAIAKLKIEGKCPLKLAHRKVQFLNNGIEVDHGQMKRLIRPTLGFQSMKTAYATIRGFEVMRMFKKGQLNPWTYGQGLWGEIRLINRQFGIFSC